MFFFVFGLPGRFAQWCDALTVELAGLALGPNGLSHAETLDQLALNALTTGASQGVVAARQPGGKLRAALGHDRRDLIVALDDPRPALVDLVLGQGVGLAAATQMVASSCGALWDWAAMPGALILHADRDAPQPAATAAAIARHLRIAVDDAALTGILRDLACASPVRPPHDTSQWWNALQPAEQQMVIGALEPYVADEDRELSAIIWTRELFFLADRPTERVAGPVDITGRARGLLEGPHIMLPPGAWSLSLSALLSRGAVEHEFLVEIAADRPLAAGALRPQRDGRAQIRLDFVLDALTERPLAIRLSSTRAAFDGAILIDRVTLLRAGAASAEAASAPAAAD
ncbi:MAG TPA: hypothetical protein VKQ73_12575 [Stellaceae bacterium]|nr:hypothetical protein [Stellaceae bacterium]